MTLDAHRGLDHGALVPLLHLRPQADLPVLQLSLPLSLDAAAALALGQALRPLRARGIAIVASGSMTHNLGEFRGPGLPGQPYVRALAQWMHERLILAGVLPRCTGLHRTCAAHSSQISVWCDPL